MSSTGALSIPERIRQERLRLGWTQAEVAARANLTTISYGRFERDGQVTLDRFLRIAAALGLSLSLPTAPDVVIAPDERVRVRQRGLRRRPVAPDPSPAPSPKPAPRAPADAPTAPARKPVRRRVAQPPDVDASAMADALKQYRQPIRNLVSIIVGNPLTNYTSAMVVQNVMRAQRVTNPAAFVAALEGELNGLTAENCALYGVGVNDLKRWSETWHPELGIVDALE